MSLNLVDVLQQKILTDIPLTQHMGLAVSYYDGQELQITASLEKNINHRQTAFGGSIASVATLAAWGWLYLQFYQRNISARIVVQQSTINYLQPIDADFVAVCKDIDADEFNKFLSILSKKGIARINLKTVVQCGLVLAADFSGYYVAKI